ncbi:MAG: suppressor of fused domain protein [Myxococcota bacterium]
MLKTAGYEIFEVPSLSPQSFSAPQTIESNDRDRVADVSSGVRKHYDRAWGSLREDIEPSYRAEGVPPYWIAIHRSTRIEATTSGSTKTEKLYSYGTVGLGALPQPGPGPQPRLEFVAYATSRDQDLLQALQALATTMATSHPDTEAFATGSLIHLGALPLRYRYFLLLQAPENLAFHRLNLSSSTDRSCATIHFVQAIPIPAQLFREMRLKGGSLPDLLEQEDLDLKVGWEQLEEFWADDESESLKRSCWWVPSYLPPQR